MRLFFLLLLVLPLWTSALAAPLNCAKARTAIDKAICADPGLRDQDRGLDAVRQLLKGHLSKLGRSRLEAQQAQWRRELSFLCRYPEPRLLNVCLEGAYQAREQLLFWAAVSSDAFTLYPAPARRPHSQLMFVDGNSPTAKFINRKVLEAARLAPDPEDWLLKDHEPFEITVRNLAGSIWAIETKVYVFNRDYGFYFFHADYFDAATSRKLEVNDFFDPSRLDELAAVLADNLRHWPEEMGRMCYEKFDAAALRSHLAGNLHKVRIGPRGMSIQLDTFQHCSAYEMPDFSADMIRPFVTETVKAFFRDS